MSDNAWMRSTAQATRDKAEVVLEGGREYLWDLNESGGQPLAARGYETPLAVRGDDPANPAIIHFSGDPNRTNGFAFNGPLTLENIHAEGNIADVTNHGKAPFFARYGGRDPFHLLPVRIENVTGTGWPGAWLLPQNTQDAVFRGINLGGAIYPDRRGSERDGLTFRGTHRYAEVDDVRILGTNDDALAILGFQPEWPADWLTQPSYGNVVRSNCAFGREIPSTKTPNGSYTGGDGLRLTAAHGWTFENGVTLKGGSGAGEAATVAFITMGGHPCHDLHFDGLWARPQAGVCHTDGVRFWQRDKSPNLPHDISGLIRVGWVGPYNLRVHADFDLASVLPDLEVVLL